MALKKVSRLSPQEFRFMAEKGLKVPEEQKIQLDIPKGFYLEVPEINIKRENGTFSAHRSYELEARIFDRIGKLREQKRYLYASQLEDMFYRIHHRQSFNRIQEEQEAMLDWVAKEQSEYLLSGNPGRLKEIHEADICNGLTKYGWTVPKLNRLLSNLSAKLPDSKDFEGRVTFAKELVPGRRVGSYRSMLEKQLAQGYF